MDAAHNLLVISDLHLGEDLGNPSERRRRHVQETEDALVAFLAHYALQRADELPWKLVIDGDMIDFLSVAVRPHEVGLDGTDDDAAFGFGATEAAALAKLDHVLQRHAAFFDGLSRFLDAGNEIHIVTGNHDAELHFEKVRDRFRTAVVDRCAHPPGTRLAFHPWFFLEPGLVYIEHGHQYDPFCSFDHPLTPEDPIDPTVLEENLGIAAMRYLGNHLPFDPAETADLSFFEYLGLLASNLHGDLPHRVLGGYAAVVRALGYQWFVRLRHPAAFFRRIEQRRARMADLAAASGIERRLLERLHRLRRPPVFITLLQLVRSVMLGRLLSAVLLPPFVITAFIIGSFFAFEAALVGAGAILAAFVGIQLWLALGRDSVDPTETMVSTARRISGMMQTPLVVFGHSHVPLARRLQRSAYYFNSGSWAGGAERRGAFTHLVLQRTAGNVRASLCRWHANESRELRAETVRLGPTRNLGRSTTY